ncbi:MAG: FkbM family methyltransferase [Gemmatimonadota bacterium]
MPSLREPVAFHLLVNGRYEPALRRLLERRLSPGDAYVDVGANVGAFVLPASRMVGPGGAVLAVEAAPGVLPYLRRTVQVNDLTNVRIAGVAAAAAASGATDFYEAPADHFGMGTRAPRFHAAPITVPADTLDGLLARHAMTRVRVLKLDVEGGEADVMDGAAGLLEGDEPPLVVFEFADWAEAGLHPPGTAQQRLLDAGFRLRRLPDFLRGRQRWLERPLTTGTETFVAERGP